VIKKIFLILFVSCFIQGPLFAMKPLEAKINEPAINFSLPDLDGKQVSLSDFKDKPVFLFFWTTWCPYCREALKDMNDAYEELKKEGLDVLAINVGEHQDKVAKFAKGYNLKYKILIDVDTAVSEEYEILGVPTYIIIGKKGNITFRGYRFPKDRLKALLAE
jgi:peroxiredoxin